MPVVAGGAVGGPTRRYLGRATAAAALAIVCGPLLGTLWWAVAPTIGYVVRDDGVFADPDAPNDWFGADGSFLVIGAGFGLVLGLVTYRRRGDHPVCALLGMTVGAVGAAVLARWVGGVLGPSPVADQLDGATSGDLLLAPLEVSALGVLVVPALVAVTGFAAMVASAGAAPPPRVEPSGLSPSGLSPSGPGRPPGQP